MLDDETMYAKIEGNDTYFVVSAQQIEDMFVNEFKLEEPQE